MSIIKHNHQVLSQSYISSFIDGIHVAYAKFYMLHEMLSLLSIENLCKFIYENLPKHLKFLH
jgi:hypothetical protein